MRFLDCRLSCTARVPRANPYHRLVRCGQYRLVAGRLRSICPLCTSRDRAVRPKHSLGRCPGHGDRYPQACSSFLPRHPAGRSGHHKAPDNWLERCHTKAEPVRCRYCRQRKRYRVAATARVALRPPWRGRPEFLSRSWVCRVFRDQIALMRTALSTPLSDKNIGASRVSNATPFRAGRVSVEDQSATNIGRDCGSSMIAPSGGPHQGGLSRMLQYKSAQDRSWR